MLFYSALAKRSYHQFCGVARALDILGERWTLLIIRDLLLGPMRYVDLQHSLEGITTNLLATRLKHLDAHGLLNKVPAPPPSGATLYELTPQGQSLRSIVLELGRFGAPTMSGGPNDDERISIRWAMVSLMRRYRGCSRPALLQLHVAQRSFVADMRQDELVMREGLTDAAVTVVRGDEPAWLQWLSSRTSARTLVETGALRREGVARPFADLTRAIGGTT